MCQKREELLKKMMNVEFPEGMCCGNYCRDCAHMEMWNDHYNDGTRRCAYKGEWLSPSSPACANFRW